MKSPTFNNKFALLGIVAALAIQLPVTAAVVNFEDLGIAPGGQIDPVNGFSSGGMAFIQGATSQISDLHVGSPAAWGVSNGTNILLTHGHVVVTQVGGGNFSLSSVDLSGFQGVEGPVRILGTYPNLTTVEVTMTLDGIIDGVGGVTDFQTFALPGTFTGLQKVELFGNTGVQGLFAIDNMVINQVGGPVPDAGATFAMFGLVVCLLRAVRRVRTS